MFSTPRSRVSTWEAETAAISGDLRVSVPSGRGGRHRIRQRGTLWGSQALLTPWAEPSCNRCGYIFAMMPQAMRPPEPPMGCAIPPQVGVVEKPCFGVGGMEVHAAQERWFCRDRPLCLSEASVPVLRLRVVYQQRAATGGRPYKFEPKRAVVL